MAKTKPIKPMSDEEFKETCKAYEQMSAIDRIRYDWIEPTAIPIMRSVTVPLAEQFERSTMMYYLADMTEDDFKIYLQGWSPWARDALSVERQRQISKKLNKMD